MNGIYMNSPPGRPVRLLKISTAINRQRNDMIFASCKVQGLHFVSQREFAYPRIQIKALIINNLNVEEAEAWGVHW